MSLLQKAQTWPVSDAKQHSVQVCNPVGLHGSKQPKVFLYLAPLTLKTCSHRKIGVTEVSRLSCFRGPGLEFHILLPPRSPNIWSKPFKSAFLSFCSNFASCRTAHSYTERDGE